MNYRTQLQLKHMGSWKTELISYYQILEKVEINRVIFQWDSLCPLLFRYVWGVCKSKTDHLLFIDDLKMFGKSCEQLDSLIHTVHTFRWDIGMEFEIKKCVVLVLKKEKVVSFDGTEIPPDGQIIKDVEEKGYEYLGVLEADSFKEKDMKDAFSKEYRGRLKLILKLKVNGKSTIMAIDCSIKIRHTTRIFS